MTEARALPAMSFGTAVGTGLRTYADFDRRASRPEFWWFVLFTTLVRSTMGALNLATPEGVIRIGSGLASIWAIGTLVPTLALGCPPAPRRRPPLDRTFWLLVPIAGLIVIVLRVCEAHQA